MFKKSISLAVAVLLIAQAFTAFAANSYTQNFNEVAPGTVNTAIPGVTGASNASVVAETISGFAGNHFRMEGPQNSSGYANITFPAVTGDVIDVSYRISIVGDGQTSLTGGQSGCPGIGVRMRDGTKNVVSVVEVGSNSSGNYYFINKAADLYNPTVLALFSPSAGALQTGNTSAAWLCPLATWVRTPNYVFSAWWYIRMKANFTTKTLDVYYSTSKPITDDMIANPGQAGNGMSKYHLNFPFGNNTAEKIDNIQIDATYAGGKARVFGLDDISIVGPAPVVVEYAIGNSTYSVAGSDVTVSSPIVKGEGDGIVFATAYDSEDRLIGVSVPSIVAGNMTYDDTFAVSGIVAKVKTFVWNSMDVVAPLCASVEATQQ